MMHALIELFYFWKTSGTKPDLQQVIFRVVQEGGSGERVTRGLERQDGILEGGSRRRVCECWLGEEVRRRGYALRRGWKGGFRKREGRRGELRGGVWEGGAGGGVGRRVQEEEGRKGKEVRGWANIKQQDESRLSNDQAGRRGRKVEEATQSEISVSNAGGKMIAVEPHLLGRINTKIIL